MEQFDYKCGEKEIGDTAAPILSVIMPVYNTERYLGQAIESVLNQSFKNLELIIVEDKSEDGSFELCRKYADSDERINLLKGEHTGVSSARNKGILEAKGRYITFVDSDDFIHPKTYETVFSLLEINECTIYTFGLTNYYKDDDEIEFMSEEKLRGKLLADNNITHCNSFNSCISQMLLSNVGFFLWNKIYPAELVKNILIDTEYLMCEDLLFNWKLVQFSNDMVVMNVPLYYYRHTNTSITRTPSMNKYIDCVKVYRYILDTAPSGITKDSYNEFIRRYIYFNIILIEIMCITDTFDLALYQNIVDIFKTYKNTIKKENVLRRIKVLFARRSYCLFKALFIIERYMRIVLKKRNWYIKA